MLTTAQVQHFRDDGYAAASILFNASEVRAKEQAIFDFYAAPDFSVARMRTEWG